MPQVHWWRKQPDGKGWAAPFLDVLDEVVLIRVNSCMVERLWSIYNCNYGAHGYQFGPGERERVTAAKFDAMHRRGL